MLSDADRKKAADILMAAEKERKQAVQLSTTWPNIEIELISTDSLPPEYTAVLITDLLVDQYAVEVESIKAVDGITQIKLVVTSKQKPDNGYPAPEASNDPKAGIGNDEKEPIRLVVPLGTDVCPTIDVLVATVNATTGRMGPFSVVARTTR